jgi:endonuclease III-like uncharacterized protein
MALFDFAPKVQKPPIFELASLIKSSSHYNQKATCALVFNRTNPITTLTR